MSNLKIRSIIIDDEEHCRQSLAKQLEWSCPEIQIVDFCVNVNEALFSIKKHSPDLVFLDIEMPEQNGFDLLKQYATIPFEVIFTTAYNDFAIEAFKVHAIDYLLKPIEEDGLIEAVERVKLILNNQSYFENIDNILSKVKSQEHLNQRVPIPIADGVQFVDVENIIRCEAQGGYCRIFCKEDQRFFISKTLLQTQNLINHTQFIRVHNSHLVNSRYIEKYIKSDGGQLILLDGSNIPVSRSRKEVLKKWISSL